MEAPEGLELCRQQRPCTDLVKARMAAFPCSGEINFKVQDVKASIARIEAEYAPQANTIDRNNGLSLEFDDWRFNLRGSNTEPVLRLNVESRADTQGVRAKVQELSENLSN